METVRGYPDFLDGGKDGGTRAAPVAPETGAPVLSWLTCYRSMNFKCHLP